MDKPLLTAAQVLPIDKLPPDAFERFICTVIPKLKPWEIVVGSVKPSDGGFDLTARRISDGNLICIQCKRYTSTLNLAHIGPELAKVALQSKIEGSLVVEHYFITTNSISSTINSALREASRSTLLDKSIGTLKDEGILITLRKDVIKLGLNPEEVVTGYVMELEKMAHR